MERNQTARIWIMRAGGALIVAIVAAAMWMAWPRHGPRFAHCPGGAATVTDATIGEPFELINHKGELVSSASVLDKPSLVYFGYTYCPDFCPTDLLQNAQAVTELEERGMEVTPVFISIDPARDTPKAMAVYVENFHPRMIGLTGSAEQVKAAARGYRVYYQKASDEKEDYLMDHSTFTYLMHPELGFLTVTRHGQPASEIAETVACYLDAIDS